MNLHDVYEKSGKPRTRAKRVGRGPGSGHGKSCGRGWRGATARQGYHANLARQGGQMPLFRRLPKRGFNNKEFGIEYVVVNLGDLAGFAAGAVVGPEEMKAKRLVVSDKPIKVLGNGKLELALTVKASRFSKAAAQKIVAAGGRAEVI
jgi:large subunit ribosomal protein L15